MDASMATATASSLFGNLEQKFDLATLLRNVAAAAAASTTVSSASTVPGSTATSPNSVQSSSSTNGPALVSSSPSPPHQQHQQSAELKPIPASSLAPPGVVQRRQLSFSPIQPIYAPSGHGRQILIYDSRSHPGRRREFAYKTRFTNQSGLTTVYYRCMACRALRHRLQRSLPKEKLPAVPCIAVKNDLLINDPDFPEASDHFCTPLTINESDQRLRNTFERGHKRARMKMANSTVEETIRKVGKIRAEEGDHNGEAEEEADGELGMELWGNADGSTSSAGLADMNGMDARDCSSDSIVDVLEDESLDEDLTEGEMCEGSHSSPLAGGEGGGEHPEERNWLGQAKMAEQKAEQPMEGPLKRAKVEACSPSQTAKTPVPGGGSSNASPFGGSFGTRSPRKKLDSLLKFAEMRAAAANGKSEVDQQHGREEAKPTKTERTNGHPKVAPEPRGTAPAISSPLVPMQLNFLLSSANQFHQPQPSMANSMPSNLQNIHAIAAHLSRGGATAASELSKALAGMNRAGTQQQQQQQQQKGTGLVNGMERIGLQQQFIGGTPIPPAMGVHIADLLKKYVENNLELAPENAGNARSAGELACALFMAQMVENAELRQEVQKLRGELDSLKALVAAAAVVQNNNGIGHGTSNGHHRH